MIKKLKKWNWSLFCLMFIIACLGAFTNDTIHTFKDAITLATELTLILGLPTAYITRDDE